jgi:hypothetical protein
MVEAAAKGEYEIALERTPAPGPSVPAELQLLRDLEDAGCTFENIPLAIAAIQQGLDLYGDQRAAEALAAIFSRLPGGRHGVELRMALLGAVGVNESARKTGVTKQSLSRSIQRLRARLFGKTVDAVPIGRETALEQK